MSDNFDLEFKNIKLPNGKTKIPVGLSFSGLKGHMAFEILNNLPKKIGVNKSELVVELLLIFGEAYKKHGDKALYKLLNSVLDE